MEQSPNPQLNALTEWISSATKDLTRGASKRLDEEYRDHYQTIVEEAMESGEDADTAHDTAMASLGSSFDTQIASLPVHGDPHRLRMKAAILLSGLILCLSSMWYVDAVVDKERYDIQDLWEAVKKGDVELAEEYLDDGINPNDRFKYQPVSILHLAILPKNGLDASVAMVSLLLEYGANPNAPGRLNNTLIYDLLFNNDSCNDSASSHKRMDPDWKLFNLLVDAGADLKTKKSPLMMTASFYNDHELIKMLRSHGVQEDLNDLAYQGRFDEIEKQLKAHPELLDSQFTSQNRNLLHLAIPRCDESFLRFLMEKGLSPLDQDPQGRDALHYYFGHSMRKPTLDINVLQLLLDSGCDPTRKDKFSGWVVHQAVVRGNEATLKLLLEHGLDLNIKSREAITPLYWAAMSQNQETTQLLLTQGADPNALDKYGRVPLHYPTNSTLVNMILEAGADVNIRDGDGNTPLGSTFFVPHVIPLYLEHGADIDAKNNLGDTPLHSALKFKLFGAVRDLLAHGADPTIADALGMIPAENKIVRTIMAGQEIEEPEFPKDFILFYFTKNDSCKQQLRSESSASFSKQRVESLL